jgi:HPt (histidine-containing phosphotransfer) domain-containing protein/uncharacterized integral membrane protein
MIAFPLIFQTRGYMNSGMLAYYIVASLLFTLLFEGRTFAVILLIFIIETIASYALANFFPQLVIPPKFPQYAYLDTISSFVVGSIVVILVIKFQKGAYKEERAENALKAKGDFLNNAPCAIAEDKRSLGKQEKEPQGKEPEVIRTKKKAADAQNGAESEKLDDLNVKRGIVLTGGTEVRYRNVLAVYMKDVQSRLPQLLSLNEAYKKGAVDEKTQSLFASQIQALKSASSGIGAEKVSAQAALLEQAGKEGRLAEIQEKLPDFCESLKSLIGLIQGTLGQSVPLVPGR